MMWSSIYWHAAFHKAIATAACKSTLNQKQSGLECASFTQRETHHVSKPSSSCTSAHQQKPPGLHKVYANNGALTLTSSQVIHLCHKHRAGGSDLVWLDVKQTAADSNYHHSSFFFCRLTVKVRFYSHLHIALLCLFTSFKALFKLVQGH